MSKRNKRTTNKEPAQPGDLQDGMLTMPLSLIRLIGAGGMGEVWEAASEDLPGHRFAVKVIAAAHVQNADVVARFFGEARAASAIDDPNIVQIHGTGRTEDGRPALVMPYIEGASLADRCDERGPLPLDAVAKVLLQMASALRAAHSHQIVHRDIKLQNVMITRRWGRDWFVILVDFGIAKFHDLEMARGINTITKQYMGTPGYSAPEQVLGKRVTYKADMYALGVLAYRILSGRAPYDAENHMALMDLQLHGPPHVPPNQLRPDIPPEWNDAIQSCLDRDPERRPTASDFAKRITAGMRNGGSLLQQLAPQIAAETRTSAGQVTLSSDVPTALSQIEEKARTRKRRSELLTTLAAGVGLGIVGTAVTLRLASSPAERPVATATEVAARQVVEAGTPPQVRAPVPAPAHEPRGPALVASAPPPVASASRPPPAPVAPAPAPVAPTPTPAASGPATAPVTPALRPTASEPAPRPAASGPAPVTPVHEPVARDRAPAQSAGKAAVELARDAGVDAPALAVAASRSGGPASPPPAPAGNDGPKPEAPPRPEKRASATPLPQGTLHVDVSPWADVSIVGQPGTHTTPVTLKLPVGRYHVVLAKGTATMSADVTIHANQTTDVTRSW